MGAGVAQTLPLDLGHSQCTSTLAGGGSCSRVRRAQRQLSILAGRHRFQPLRHPGAHPCLQRRGARRARGACGQRVRRGKHAGGHQQLQRGSHRVMLQARKPGLSIVMVSMAC